MLHPAGSRFADRQQVLLDERLRQGHGGGQTPSASECPASLQRARVAAVSCGYAGVVGAHRVESGRQSREQEHER